MNAARFRPFAIATLLLAVFASSSALVGSHGHDPLAETHSGLPSFDAGHSRPDPSAHVESAAAVDSPDCAACLLRQRPRAVLTVRAATAAICPETAAAIRRTERSPSAGAKGLPSGRGPPLA